MKNITFLTALFITLFAFSACNNDDDSDAVQDPLVGDWEMSHTRVEGVDIPIETCEGNGTFSFAANGTMETTSYEENSSGECVVAGTGTGTWKNEGNSTYTFTSGDDVESLEVIFEGDDYFYFEIEDDLTDEFIISVIFKRI